WRDRRQHHRRGGNGDIQPMVLAHGEDLEAGGIGELGGRENLLQPLVGADGVAVPPMGGQLTEGIGTGLHGCCRCYMARRCTARQSINAASDAPSGRSMAPSTIFGVIVVICSVMARNQVSSAGKGERNVAANCRPASVPRTLSPMRPTTGA